MSLAHVGKVVGSLIAVGGVIAAVSACEYRDHDRYDRGDCDYVETSCRQVCDYYCDYYSCYPTCWDQCWDDCGQYPKKKRPPQGSSSGTSGSSGASSGVVDPVVDAEVPPSLPVDAGSGTGVLCSSCSSNADCEEGALCILRGGPPRDAGATDGGAPAGRGFCGATCTTSQDCPDGFLCSQLGSTRQCLPTGNACQ